MDSVRDFSFEKGLLGGTVRLPADFRWGNQLPR